MKYNRCIYGKPGRALLTDSTFSDQFRRFHGKLGHTHHVNQLTLNH